MGFNDGKFVCFKGYGAKITY